MKNDKCEFHSANSQSFSFVQITSPSGHTKFPGYSFDCLSGFPKSRRSIINIYSALLVFISVDDGNIEVSVLSQSGIYRLCVVFRACHAGFE